VTFFKVIYFPEGKSQAGDKPQAQKSPLNGGLFNVARELGLHPAYFLAIRACVNLLRPQGPFYFQ